MTAHAMATPPRRLLRSTGAVLLGFFTVVVLSLGTDQVLHMLDVYPPWGQPMNDTGDNLLALAYRTVFGSYIAAWGGAPRVDASRHDPGFIRLVPSTAGAIAAIAMADLGPAWFPIALVLTALPCA